MLRPRRDGRRPRTPARVGTNLVPLAGILVNVAYSSSSLPSAWIHPWVGRTFSGRYRLDSMLLGGRGSTVFEGRDLRSSEPVEVTCYGASESLQRGRRKSTRSSFPLATAPSHEAQDEDGPTVIVHEREAATVVRASRPTMPFKALMTATTDLAGRLEASACPVLIRSLRPISSSDRELSPEAAFVYSCIGAEIGVDELVDICPFERSNCVSHLEQLERLGIVAISSSIG